MKNLLRQALEGDEEVTTPEPEDQREVVMKGPLSEIYTQALQEALSKEGTETVAVESQAIDATLLKRLSSYLTQGSKPPATNNFQTVYGVSKAEINDDTVVDVTKELADQDDQDNGEFILIMDGTQPGETSEFASSAQERVVWTGQALECMVLAHGGKVFNTFKDYVQSRGFK